MFGGSPKGELPHLRSFRLKGGACINVCADQQFGQCLIRATGNQKLGPGARLKATDARNLPKPVKVNLRTKDKSAKSPDELLNPGLHIEFWRTLDRRPEPKSLSSIYTRTPTCLYAGRCTKTVQCSGAQYSGTNLVRMSESI
jgi:hypothetical protein